MASNHLKCLNQFRLILQNSSPHFPIISNYSAKTSNSLNGAATRRFSLSSKDAQINSGNLRVGGEKCSVRKLKIGVQGAPVDRGQPKFGVADGPRICRESGFIEILRGEVGQDIKDYGDLSIVNDEKIEVTRPSKAGMKNLKDVAKANKIVSEGVRKILQDDRIALTLGGDHSIGIGTIDGVSSIHNDLAILWVDAHCDLNTPSTSNSGNIHGMSLSFVIKELESYVDKISEFSWVVPRISASNIAYIGLRDVDQAERTILDMLGITAFSMKDVDLLGIRQVTKLALEAICPGNTRPLHVSYDIDVLDVSEVTTTGTPVPGGLTLREGIAILEDVYKAGNLVSMDLVEVNPSLGTTIETAKTVAAVKQLLIHAFGYHRGGIPFSHGKIPLAGK